MRFVTLTWTRGIVGSVASARRSGQKDFQRGTPPVSLASCSISPFLRACIITEWSSKDHETDSTGTSILIPLLLLKFNMRLHGNPTAWYLFLATDPHHHRADNLAHGTPFLAHFWWFSSSIVGSSFALLAFARVTIVQFSSRTASCRLQIYSRFLPFKL